MKRCYKKIYLGFIFFIIILSGCTTTSISNSHISSSKHTNIQPIKQNKQTNKNDLDFSIVGLQEDLDFLTTYIEYPEFNNLEGLNKHVKKLIESGWLDFKEFAEKDWNEITSLNSNVLPPYEYFVKTSVSASGDIISIYFNIYSYKGGAHGESIIKTINYNKETNKYLTIIETSSFTYDELSDICRKELHNKLISDNKFEIEQQEAMILSEMIDEGTLPIASNFEAFTVNKNELTVYFSQGKVAPNYYGEQSVSIPLKK